MRIEESAEAVPDGDELGAGRQSAAPPPARPARGRRGRRWALLAALLVLGVIGVALALLARSLVSAKDQAQEAQHDLLSAKEALKAGHVQQARDYVRQARDHVEQAQSQAGGLAGNAWSVVPVADSAVDDERHLIEALDETTSAAELGVEIYPIVSGRSAQLVRGERIDLHLLREVADRTTAIGPHLDRAMAQLNQVTGSTPIVGGSIVDARTSALAYLQPLRQTYRASEPVLHSLPGLLGANGPRTYLLAMLNPSELRYSGGGALSFTTIRFVDGVATFGRTVNVDDIIAKGDTQSWTPLKGNTFHRRPPQPVANATFSPWWSVSGEELLRGYRKAFPGPAFDGLIGVDLQGLAALFKVTGPVELPSFGTITSENLVRTLGGSYGDFDSIEQRHRLNAELVPAFRQQLFQGGRISEKVTSLVDSAAGRHFVVYFRSPSVERRFGRLGLTGDLSPTSYDYLGVFSQNLNGSKVDYWQHRDVTSTVQLHPDGSAQVHLHVAISNQAPRYDLPVPDPKIGYTTRYLGTRIGIFLPRRSTLESASLDGTPAELKTVFPNVATVRNRKYVEAPFLLDSGDTATIDLRYHKPNAAEVVSPHTMTYRLDVDPQDLVSAPVFHISVAWPAGYRPSGRLPSGWAQTTNGASFDGPLPTRMAWQIPLAKS